MEYQKFMGKEAYVSPEKIIVSEDPLLSQMNEEEKARMEFLNMRNNKELYQMKYGHQKGFNDTLNDTIKIINEGHKLKMKSEEAKKEERGEWYKKIKRRMFWIQISAVLILLPFMINAASRRAYFKKREMERRSMIEKIRREQEIKEVQERMVFDEKYNVKE